MRAFFFVLFASFSLTTFSRTTGVFVAGDLHRGASLVVWAIRDGMDAARSIESYLSNRLQVLGAAE